MSDVKRAHEPQDRLGRIADAMTDALDAHAEHRDGDKAIVMLVSGQQCMAHLHGYDDDVDAIGDLFMQLRAIVRGNGKDLIIIGMPDDASGLDER